jgi:putative flippase GtrA
MMFRFIITGVIVWIVLGIICLYFSVPWPWSGIYLVVTFAATIMSTLFMDYIVDRST